MSKTYRSPRGSTFIQGIIRSLVVISMLFIHGPSWSMEDELKVKTAYIFNFTKFIQWPDDSGVIRICAPSHHEIAKHLNALETKKANNKEIKVNLYDSVKEIDKCNIVYLSEISEDLHRDIIGTTKNKPIVTISQKDEFKNDQSMIQFYILRFYKKGGRLRFSINLDQAKAANISVSSTLIKFANMK